MASTDTAKHLETLIGLIEAIRSIIEDLSTNNLPQQLDDTCKQELLLSKSRYVADKTFFFIHIVSS